MSNTILVSNSVQLLTAAKTAAAGDTILLASGDYGAVAFSGITKVAGTVTIASADPAAPANFYSLKMTGVSGFTLQSLTFSHALQGSDTVWSSALTINKSSNITVVGSQFTGSLDNDASNDGYGINVSDSNHLTVLNSTFQQMHVGAVFTRSSDIIIAGNTITSSREGVDFLDAHNVLVDRNYVTNLQPMAGDHPDAFQISTGSGGGVSSDVTFSNNVMIEGTAGPIGGIFIRDEHNADGSLHNNITIKNNYYSGTYTNAISVVDVNNILIDNNTVLMSDKPGNVSAIIVGNLHHAIISDSIAPIYMTRTDSVCSDLGWSNNIDVWDSKTKIGVSASDLFNGPAGNLTDLSKLNPLSGSLADVNGVGFRSVDGIGQLTGTIDQQLATYMPMHDHLQANTGFVLG